MDVYDWKPTDLIQLGLMNSQWELTSGGDSEYYVDMDRILSDPDKVEAVAKGYLTEIESIRKDPELGPIDCLAFVEKGSGPIGALSLKDLLIVRSGIPGIVVRTQRRVLPASIKGRPLTPNERVLLISDVATSGASILKAARVIWTFHAQMPCALVYFDREQGAADNLKRVDIHLRSITRRSELPEWPELERTSLLLSISSASSIRPAH